MKPPRAFAVFVVGLVVAGLSGAAGVFARLDAAPLPGLPQRPSPVPPLLARQIATPDCTDQDGYDDRDEAKAGKPDTDNIELQCGHQDDDDDEIEDGRAKHERRDIDHGTRTSHLIGVAKKAGRQ